MVTTKMMTMMMIVPMVIRKAGYFDRHRMKSQVKMIDADDAFDDVIADADDGEQESRLPGSAPGGTAEEEGGSS